MTEVDQAKTLVLRRLHGALSQALPPKAVARGNALLERLNASVRIGLFGLPGAGKRTVLNMLAQDEIIAPGLDLPTLELVHGGAAQTHMMLGDGTSLSASGYPTVETTEVAPVYLQIQTPSPLLSGCSILLAATDANPRDMSAALAWAAPRVDLTVWCTRHWSALEQQVWDSAPDALRNHAVLILTGDGNAVSPDFEKVLGRKDGANIDARIAKLAVHLEGIIADATEQDLIAADLFLQKFAKDVPAEEPAPVTAEPATTAPEPAPLTADPAPTVPEPTALDHALDADSLRLLSQLFQHIRTEALRLYHSRDSLSPDACIDQIVSVFETLSDRLYETDALEVSVPEICDTIEDARDTAVLMRIEKRPEQAPDAAMLLVQVRQDIEELLAA